MNMNAVNSLRNKSSAAWLQAAGLLIFALGLVVIAATGWMVIFYGPLLLPLFLGSALFLWGLSRRPGGSPRWMSASAAALCGGALGWMIGGTGFLIVAEAWIGGGLDQGAYLAIITAPVGAAIGGVGGLLAGLRLWRLSVSIIGAVLALPFAGVVVLLPGLTWLAMSIPVALGLGIWVLYGAAARLRSASRKPMRQT
jgi:hypothetical protein